MAYDNSFTAVTGQSLAAADWNTAVKGNWTASWVGTTAGDTDYYTSATAKSRVAKGTARQIYVMNAGATAPEWVDLTTITAAKALVSSQAAGDIPYASSSSALSRLAIGALHTFVKSDGSAPVHGSLVYRRKGGSSTIWTTTGTTSYTPSTSLVQAGSVSVTITSGNGTGVVTFDTAYTYAPLVFVTVYSTFTKKILYYVQAISTTGFTVYVGDLDAEGYGVTVWWLSLGS